MDDRMAETFKRKKICEQAHQSHLWSQRKGAELNRLGCELFTLESAMELGSDRPGSTGSADQDQ